MSTVSNSGDYVKKNQINQLFEDMRYQLLESHPEDPIDFLIKVLRAKQKLKAEHDPHLKNGSLPNRQYDKPWLRGGPRGGLHGNVVAGKSRRASSALESGPKSDSLRAGSHGDAGDFGDVANTKRGDLDGRNAGEFDRGGVDEGELLEREKVRSFKREREIETTGSNGDLVKSPCSAYKKSMMQKNKSKMRSTKHLEMLADNDRGENDQTKDSGFENDEEDLIDANAKDFVTEIITLDSQADDAKSEISMKNSTDIICAICKKEIKNQAPLSNAKTVGKSLGMSLMDKSYQSFFESDEDIESASQVSGPRMPVWKPNDKTDKNKDDEFKDQLLSARSKHSVESMLSNKSINKMKLSYTIQSPDEKKNSDRVNSINSTVEADNKNMRHNEMPSARSAHSIRSAGSNISSKSLAQKKLTGESIKMRNDDNESLIANASKGWNIGDNSDTDTLIKEKIGSSVSKSISKAT